MKVRLIKIKTIIDFTLKYPSSKPAFESWLSIVKQSDWKSPLDIVKTFNTCDIIGNGFDRVIFNIAGNNFRLIAKYRFGINTITLYIKWIGSRKEYSKLCKNQQQYYVSIY